MHNHTAPPTWILTYFPIVFPVWWCFIIYVISRFGWARLAKAYQARESPINGATYRGCAGTISGSGSGNYKGCLRVTLTSTGIYTVPMFVFRPFHSPLLLPWRGVQSVTEESKLFAFRQTKIRFVDQEGYQMTLLLPVAALNKVFEVSGRNDFSLLPSGQSRQ